MGSKKFDRESETRRFIINGINVDSRLTRGTFTDVLIQLGIGIGLSAGTILIFSILRRKNEIVHMPRRPPELGVGFFSWMWPLLRTSETELLENIGLDAVIFLRLLKMCRWMCGLLALLACILLIPCDLVSAIHRESSINMKGASQINCTEPEVLDNSTSTAGNVTYTRENATSPGNVTSTRSNCTDVPLANRLLWVNAISIEGPWLYPHILYGYIGTFIVLYLIYSNYKSVLFLKSKWFRTPKYQNSILSRSIMLTHVGPEYMSDTGLQQLFTRLGVPYAATAVYFGRRVGILSFLIRCHNQNVRNLEEALVTYLKGGNVSRKRPMIRVHDDIQCMWPWGKKVDSINFYTKKIKQYEREIEKERHEISYYKPESYAFASFETVAHAHTVAKQLSTKKIKGISISLAPPPQDIIWDNLTKPRWLIWCQRALSRILITIFGIIYTLPLALILFLAQVIFDPKLIQSQILDSPEPDLGWLVIFGVVPPLLSLLFQLAPLAVLRALGKLKRTATHQQLDRAVFSEYYCFLAAFQFLFFSGMSSIVIFAEKPKSVGLPEVKDVLQVYILESNYWLTWFPLKIFTASIKLVQILSFMSCIISKLWNRHRTPREIREWTKPTDFDYPVHMANIMFMLLVALIYAPLAPLVTLLATGVFYASSWIYKYQLMYISTTKCESGGRIWRMLINRILISLIVMHGFLFFKIAADLGVLQSMSVLPLFAIVVSFKLFLKFNFDSKFRWYIPKGKEFCELRHHCDDAQQNLLVKQFGHPFLHEELLTPMVHEDHQKFLEGIYSGKDADNATDDAENPLNCDSAREMNYLDGTDSRIGFQPEPAREQQVGFGGLRFSLISKENLTYSHREFLLERTGANTSPPFPMPANENMNYINQNSNTTIQSRFNLHSRSNNEISYPYRPEQRNDVPATPSTMHGYPLELIGYEGPPSEPPNNTRSDIFQGSSLQQLL